MQKIKTFSYLKKFRERTGFTMQDMATIIGMKTGSLSKIESGLVSPSIEVILSYHLMLNIPIKKLFKNHVRKIIIRCLERSLDLKESLLDTKASPFIYKRLDLLEIIISRLKELNEEYE